MRRLIDSWGCF